ncbi:hypothetical protein GCM10007052_17840 [Halioglobus japonicus]|nr:hypothetical protein GCM10007052_17840 [Halioglobus japonicus]
MGGGAGGAYVSKAPLDVVIESHHITMGPSAVFSREVERGELALLELPVPIRWYAACLTRPKSGCPPVVQRVMQR